MIKESYCSYEISKLLKEKGLSLPCLDLTKIMFKDGEKPVTKVTLQMACAWLREKGIEIDAYLSHITDEFGKKTKHYVFSIVDLNTDKDYPEYSEDYHYYPTYEKAVEAALKYSLENLI